MKLIAFFEGTDALLISRWDFPCRPYKRLYQIFIRFRTWFLDFFITEYRVDHESLKRELIKFGIRKKIITKSEPVWYPVSFKKKPHSEFNVLYYFPGNRGNAKMWQWIYGFDVFLEIKDILENQVKWIVVDGSKNMESIFPIIDFYLRPNRHDGSSRLRQECEIQKIPYYWSRETPKINEAVFFIRNVIKDAR